MTSRDDAKPKMTPARLPWQTPRLRRIPASEAQMPVGKATVGGDGVSMS